MLKFVIVGTATLAFVGTAVAADLPHPQPVYQPAQVGKMPIGKYPVGKYSSWQVPGSPGSARNQGLTRGLLGLCVFGPWRPETHLPTRISWDIDHLGPIASLQHSE